jgi:hypothetical protein
MFVQVIFVRIFWECNFFLKIQKDFTRKSGIIEREREREREREIHDNHEENNISIEMECIDNGLSGGLFFILIYFTLHMAP